MIMEYFVFSMFGWFAIRSGYCLIADFQTFMDRSPSVLMWSLFSFVFWAGLAIYHGRELI